MITLQTCLYIPKHHRMREVVRKQEPCVRWLKRGSFNECKTSLFRQSLSVEFCETTWRPVSVLAAKGSGSKAKSKARGKRKARGREKDLQISREPSVPRREAAAWDFEQVLTVWDEQFELITENAEKAAELRAAAAHGLKQHGRGVVLARLGIRTLPRSSGSGFGAGTAKMTMSENGEQEFPPTEVTSYSLAYIPHQLLATGEVALPADKVPLVSREEVMQLLRYAGGDLSRLLQLCSKPFAEGSKEKEWASREASYDPDKGELVVMLDMMLDGMHYVGADVMFVEDNQLRCKGLEGL